MRVYVNKNPHLIISSNRNNVIRENVYTDAWGDAVLLWKKQTFDMILARDLSL